MKKITLDPETRTKLHNLTEVLAVVDETGQVRGYVVPEAPAGKKLEVYYRPDHSEEELKRRMSERGGKPLAEILQNLQSQ